MGRVMVLVHCTSPLWDLSTYVVSRWYLKYFLSYAPDKNGLRTDRPTDRPKSAKQYIPLFFKGGYNKMSKVSAFNNIKLTSIPVQIRPKSDQYTQVQGWKTGLMVFCLSRPYFTENCTISRQGNSNCFYYFVALLKAYNTQLNTNICFHYLRRYTAGNSSPLETWKTASAYLAITFSNRHTFAWNLQHGGNTKIAACAVDRAGTV